MEKTLEQIENGDLPENGPSTIAQSEGSFGGSLKRTNKKIRDDRAEAIEEEAEMAYRRSVENMQLAFKRMTRERANMLDLSPENSMSLMLASDFDSQEFVKRDIAYAVDLRNLQIKLDLATRHYQILFGRAI